MSFASAHSQTGKAARRSPGLRAAAQFVTEPPDFRKRSGEQRRQGSALGAQQRGIGGRRRRFEGGAAAGEPAQAEIEAGALQAMAGDLERDAIVGGLGGKDGSEL